MLTCHQHAILFSVQLHGQETILPILGTRITNMADCFTMHHTMNHNQTMHPKYLHLEHLASNLHHHANHEGVLISMRALIDHKPIGMTKAHSAQQSCNMECTWSFKCIGGMHTTVECTPSMPAMK